MVNVPLIASLASKLLSTTTNSAHTLFLITPFMSFTKFISHHGWLVHLSHIQSATLFPTANFLGVNKCEIHIILLLEILTPMYALAYLFLILD